jgi:hypothetical protein
MVGFDYPIPNTHTIISSVQQSLDGPSIGIYGSATRGAWFSDFTLRSDFLNVSQTVTQDDRFGVLISPNLFGVGTKFQGSDPDFGCINLKKTAGTADPANDLIPASTVVNISSPASHLRVLSHTTTQYNYTIGDDVGYRFDLPYDGLWFEPSFGGFYSYSNMAANAALLGLKDGYTVRLRGGGRIGLSSLFMNDYVWTGTIGGFLYDDVVVNGYQIANGLPATAAAYDQGKLRVLGVVQSNIDFLNGIRLYAEFDTYGGIGLFGIGGKFGGKVAW